MTPIRNLREWLDELPPHQQARPGADLRAVHYGHLLNLYRGYWSEHGTSIQKGLEPERVRLARVSKAGYAALETWLLETWPRYAARVRGWNRQRPGRRGAARIYIKNSVREYPPVVRVALRRWAAKWLRELRHARREPLTLPLVRVAGQFGLDEDVPWWRFAGVFEAVGTGEADLDWARQVQEWRQHSHFQCPENREPPAKEAEQYWEDLHYGVLMPKDLASCSSVPKDYYVAVKEQARSPWLAAEALTRLLAADSRETLDKAMEWVEAVSVLIVDWYRANQEGPEFFEPLRHHERRPLSANEDLAEVIFGPYIFTNGPHATPTSRNAESLALMCAALLRRIAGAGELGSRPQKPATHNLSTIQWRRAKPAHWTALYARLFEWITKAPATPKQRLEEDAGLSVGFLSRGTGRKVYDAALAFVRDGTRPSGGWYLPDVGYADAPDSTHDPAKWAVKREDEALSRSKS